MEERRPEARAVPESERMRGTEPTAPMGEVTPMGRAAAFPAWLSRISWGSVIAGVLVAIAAQLVLSAIGVLVGFGTTTVTSVTALRDISTGVGIWTAISALIALFIGGYVASRVADIRFSSDGLWHGLTVWAFALVAGILLSAVGITGLLGFASNALAAVRGVISTGATVSPSDLKTAADLASRSAGYFLLGSLLGLAAALLGGWLGSRRMSRAEAARMEAGRTRMAA